jgi:RNA polymerase sigma-70 factor (ECF subfamily)
MGQANLIISSFGDASTSRTKDASRNFERDLVALIPQLRSFARGLCKRRGISEDMAQEALAKAWRARDQFVTGTNLKAWLFTILRHEFYSHIRRDWREMTWDEQLGKQIPAPADEQLWAMDIADCMRAFAQLPKIQRDAILLIGVGGFSYEEAANRLGTASGTVKSRTMRGRARLAKLVAGLEPLPLRAPVPALPGPEDFLTQLAHLKANGVAPASHA